MLYTHTRTLFVSTQEKLKICLTTMRIESKAFEILDRLFSLVKGGICLYPEVEERMKGNFKTWMISSLICQRPKYKRVYDIDYSQFNACETFHGFPLLN